MLWKTGREKSGMEKGKRMGRLVLCMMLIATIILGNLAGVFLPGKAEAVASVSCGYYHTAILKKDGSLWMTGNNGSSPLGDGTNVFKKISRCHRNMGKAIKSFAQTLV